MIWLSMLKGIIKVNYPIVKIPYEISKILESNPEEPQKPIAPNIPIEPKLETSGRLIITVLMIALIGFGLFMILKSDMSYLIGLFIIILPIFLWPWILEINSIPSKATQI